MLIKIFHKFGVPESIKSDNGPAFRSAEFKLFATKFGFNHMKLTPLWPRANGTVERFMKNINKSIRCSNVTKTNWKKDLFNMVENYKSTPHSSTGLTSKILMFGKDEQCKIPSLNQPINDHILQERA